MNIQTNQQTQNSDRREELQPPRSFNGDLGRLPAALQPLTKEKRWVVWRWELGTNKWTKVPYQAQRPRFKASSTNDATWSSYETALRAYQNNQADGIGFCLVGSGLGAFDLDKCRDLSNGAITRQAQELVKRLASYTETTVSGSGLRIIGRALGEEIHRKDNYHGLQLETYRDAKRYIVITGKALPGTPARLADIDAHMDEIVGELDAAKARTEEHQDQGTDRRAGILPPKLEMFLHLPDPGGGNPCGGYTTRSEALFAFLCGAIRDGIADGAILDALFDPGFAGNALHQHVADEGGEYYAKRQLTKAHAKVGSAGSDRIHDWDDPDLSLLDDRRGELPSFPLRTLPSQWLRDWAQRAATGTGTTIDHVVVPLIGITSALIGTGRRTQATGSWTEPMTLWTVLIGESGSGKTPGIDASRAALAQVDEDQSEDIVRLKRRHAEQTEHARAAMKHWKKLVAEAVKHGRPTPEQPAAAAEPEPFIAPRLYTTDITIERMAALVKARPQGMLLLTDELAGWFKNMSRYSGGQDNQFWLISWDGKRYVVERMGRPAMVIDHLLVGVVGGLQPSWLMDVFNKHAADGMPARFLYSWPQWADYRPLSDSCLGIEPDLVNLLGCLAHLEKRVPGAVPLSKDARAAFEVVRQEAHQASRRHSGREQEWLAKAPAQVLRMAGTLAFIDWAVASREQPRPDPREIKACYVKAAAELVGEYFWAHAKAALRQIGLTAKDADARRLLHQLRERQMSEVSREQVRVNLLHCSRDAEETQAILERLERTGWLRRFDPGRRKAGRPSVRWEVNPRLGEGSSGH